MPTSASAFEPGPVKAARAETLRRVARRLAAVAGGACVFVLVASLIEPGVSPAEEQGPRGSEMAPLAREQVQQRLLALHHPKGWKPLGLIEGVDHYLLIHASPAGPRYTVCALSGQILQADLPADEVYRAFPSVDVEGMRLEPAIVPEPTLLMMADTPE